MSKQSRIRSELAAEVSFAVLPLIVVLIILCSAGHSAKILSSPEWSFGTSILFGQTLVKFVSSMARGGNAETGPVALTVAILLVFGLVPSLVVLTMTLQASEAKQEPALWLCIMQLILFSSSVVVYIMLGTVGEMWKHEVAGANNLFRKKS